MAVQEFKALDPDTTYTYQDYLNWQFTERVELILGKIFPMSPAPQTQHQHAITVLTTGLYTQLGNTCRVFAAPFDVILASDNNYEKATTVVQPDITVVCDVSKLRPEGCFGPPELVVEIISPSTIKRDLQDKRGIYEDAAVPEYWIVQPREKTLTILTLGQDGRYQASPPMTAGDRLQSRIFPDLYIDLNPVFTDVVKEPEPTYAQSAPEKNNPC